MSTDRSPLRKVLASCLVLSILIGQMPVARADAAFDEEVKIYGDCLDSVDQGTALAEMLNLGSENQVLEALVGRAAIIPPAFGPDLDAEGHLKVNPACAKAWQILFPKLYESQFQMRVPAGIFKESFMDSLSARRQISPIRLPSPMALLQPNLPGARETFVEVGPQLTIPDVTAYAWGDLVRIVTNSHNPWLPLRRVDEEPDLDSQTFLPAGIDAVRLSQELMWSWLPQSLKALSPKNFQELSDTLQENPGNDLLWRAPLIEDLVAPSALTSADVAILTEGLPIPNRVNLTWWEKLFYSAPNRLLPGAGIALTAVRMLWRNKEYLGRLQQHQTELAGAQSAEALYAMMNILTPSVARAVFVGQALRGRGTAPTERRYRPELIRAYEEIRRQPIIQYAAREADRYVSLQHHLSTTAEDSANAALFALSFYAFGKVLGWGFAGLGWLAEGAATPIARAVPQIPAAWARLASNPTLLRSLAQLDRLPPLVKEGLAHSANAALGLMVIPVIDGAVHAASEGPRAGTLVFWDDTKKVFLVAGATGILMVGGQRFLALQKVLAARAAL